MTLVHKILCPVDFSDCSRAALDYAVELKGLLSAELHVVHCYDIPMFAAPEGAVIAPPSVVTAIANDAERRLTDLIAAYPDTTFETKAIKGPAGVAIAEHADHVGADLIVMGTHGRSGLARLLVGSVTESTLRHTGIPVLAVPPKSHS